MQARLLADSKVLVVLGLDTLQPDILSHDVVRHIAAGRNEVATRLQVSAPERLAELSAIHQQMVRRLPFYRLHDAARSKMRRYAQQQMYMVWTHVPLQNLDIVRPTNLPDQVSDVRRHVPAQDRLAILRDEHEVIVQGIERMGRPAIPFHAGQRIASLLKASPKGEGLYPPRVGH